MLGQIKTIIIAAVCMTLLVTAGFTAFWVLSGPVEEALDVFVEAPTPTPLPMLNHYGEIPTVGRWDEGLIEENIFRLPNSFFTGLPIYEEYLHRRPVAVVVNNLLQALPQSGIGYADIIYEVLSEGQVTRLVAIFQSYWPEKIGPVRSARDYFVDFAFNHDAIFVHHGASPSGYGRIRNLRIDSMDGMALEGFTFWRDRTYPEWARNSGTRPLEHSSYTSDERLRQRIYDVNMRDYLGEDPAFGFRFGSPQQAHSGEALTVTVPFSPGYIRRFIFDESTGLYLVEYPHGALYDAINHQQVSVTNILIQLTSKTHVPGDGAGRRNVHTVGSGRGYLATGGVYFPLLWEKDGHTEPMRWYFEDGTPLTLNPGRTWINVFQSNGVVEFGGVEVEESLEEE
ncbi:MAG: DUF3048 domain-containing protein [Defluviitaleaceae bacterium]|nr:DUF3048 domain-containing protein [Defluviitaleaceae bacterium]